MVAVLKLLGVILFSANGIQDLDWGWVGWGRELEGWLTYVLPTMGTSSQSTTTND